MSIKYNLTINNLIKYSSINNLNDVVYKVLFSINAYSEIYPEITYDCDGFVELNVSNINSETFISFNDITQETVIDWILKKEGVTTVEEFSTLKFCISDIQRRINELQPTESIEVNWSVGN